MNGKIDPCEDVLIDEHKWARLYTVKTSQSDVTDERKLEDVMPRAKPPRTPAGAEATKDAEKDLVVTHPHSPGDHVEFFSLPA